MQGPPPSAASPSQQVASQSSQNVYQALATPAPGVPHAAGPSTPTQPSYYTGYPAPWHYGAWQYPYNPGAPPTSLPRPYQNDSTWAAVHLAAPGNRPLKRKTPPPSPSPPPSPPLPREWDGLIKTFLSTAGLRQALHGFEMDMLVMSEHQEHHAVSQALEVLQAGLTVSKTCPVAWSS